MDDVKKLFVRIWEGIEYSCMRFLFVGFYFSILLPFGVAVLLLADPLRKRPRHATNTYWERYPSDDGKSCVDRRAR